MSFVVPITRREAVLRSLRDDIVSGALPQGSVLKDSELAAQLGVSITPVREAITQLAAEGLIDIAPNRTRRVTRVTQKNALELIDVMGVLACAGFEWGVHLLTPTHLDQLHQRLDEFVAALREATSARRADRAPTSARSSSRPAATVSCRPTSTWSSRAPCDCWRSRPTATSGRSGSTPTARRSPCSTPTTGRAPSPATASSTPRCGPRCRRRTSEARPVSPRRGPPWRRCGPARPAPARRPAGTARG